WVIMNTKGLVLGTRIASPLQIKTVDGSHNNIAPNTCDCSALLMPGVASLFNADASQASARPRVRQLMHGRNPSHCRPSRAHCLHETSCCGVIGSRQAIY